MNRQGFPAIATARLALFAGIARLCIVPATAAAQDDAGEAVIELPSQPVTITSPTGRLADRFVLPILTTESACGRDAIMPGTVADAMGCAFTDTTAGLRFGHELAADAVTLGTELSVARGTRGAFALDHQIHGFRRGLNAETTLGSLALNVSLLDGAIEATSKTSWSSNWEVPVAAPPLLPRRYNEKTGFAHEHQLKLRLIDGDRVRWTIGGKLSNADSGYHPYNASLPDRLFAIEGSRRSFDTQLDLGDWRFKLHAGTIENRFMASDTAKISASHGGFTLAAMQRSSRSEFGLADALRSSILERRRLSLDINFFELFPLVATDDTGWGSLLPKLATFEFEEARIDRSGPTGRNTRDRSGFAAMALWSTPLGDTIVNVRRESEADRSAADPGSGSDTFLLVSHSFPIGDWSVDLNYMKTRNTVLDGVVVSDDTSMGSFGIGARYAKKGMPQLRLSLGRDDVDLDSSQGDLQLRDRSLSAKAEVDFTPWLQRVAGRDDIRLTLDARWDFENRAYELTFLDEVIDREIARSQSRGLLLNFSMKLR